MSLNEALSEPDRRAALIEDLAVLVEKHVAGVRGLRGIGLRTGLSMLKAARPGATREAVEKLLPQSLDALDPWYTEYLQAGAQGGFDRRLLAEPEAVSQALLSVADQRVAASKHASLSAMYGKLRPAIGSELLALVPALAATLARYLPL